MAIKYGSSILLLLAFANVCYSIATNTNDVLSPSESAGESSRILSRRKRFLVFPDGSSFQLVFCTQNHGYIQVGDIVWFGNTAALAWELPSDPKLFYLLKDHTKPFAQNRDGFSKHIYYLDEDGKVLSKVPYKKKFIVSPVFAKRSIDDHQKVKIFDVKEMHERQLKTKHLDDLDEDSKQFHREGRVDLFPKLEKFLEGLGWRGKECVLRMLCESARENTAQGTFLEEILRAAFTLPSGKEFVDQEHKEYDKAHRSNGDCEQLYPQCTTLREFNEINMFCTQNHGYIQVGDIVWFGNTAALAWELPSDPKLFYLLKDHTKPFAQNRDGSSKHIYYLDEEGKVLSKVPYKKKFIVSPVFAKRSIDDHQKVKIIDVKEMHDRQLKTKHLDDLDEDSKQFHREGRVDLFPKLEKFLEGLGWRGKECVLRMLCESARENTAQGTFLEEILRATFTLPSGKDFVDQEHKEYDKAHRSNGDCEQLYPQCTTLREFNEINSAF